MGKGNIQGAGDLVSSVTKFLGIQPCEECLKRKAKWNAMFPLRLKPREMTEAEIKQWKDYQERRTLRLSTPDGIMLCQLYADVFQVPLYPFCASCSASPYLTMIERLDKIVKTYEN